MRDTERGVTFIELILVVAIIALLGAASTPFLSRFLLRTYSDTTARNVTSALRTAQHNAMAQKANLTWGVCLTGNTIRMYGGSCATPTIMNDHTFPSSVSVTGLSDTSFDTRGEPSGTLSVTISSAITTDTVTMGAAGDISQD